MMKHEFEKMIGTEITAPQWESVEELYTNSDMEKHDVAALWMARGFNGVEIARLRNKVNASEAEKVKLRLAVKEAETERDEALDSLEHITVRAKNLAEELKEARMEVENVRAERDTEMRIRRDAEEALNVAGGNVRELREMVAKLEAELREACVQLFRAQKGVQ